MRDCLFFAIGRVTPPQGRAATSLIGNQGRDIPKIRVIGENRNVSNRETALADAASGVLLTSGGTDLAGMPLIPCHRSLANSEESTDFSTNIDLPLGSVRFGKPCADQHCFSEDSEAVARLTVIKTPSRATPPVAIHVPSRSIHDDRKQ